MNLVIVESPAKAKTLKKFLGKTYKIEASIGHIRDLPKSQMGVDFENDYEPKYITIRGKGDILAKLKKEAKSAKKVYLATDPDREGEAISWHLQNVLGVDDAKVSRITFNQITKDAVKNAIKEARPINMQLVDAQQARRILDRVVGYKISPLLWKKLRKKGLSAGRVQSVALRMICDREQEIESFIPEEYWSMDADLTLEDTAKKVAQKHIFSAKLFATTENGKEVKLADKSLKNEAMVLDIEAKIKGHPFVVSDISTSKRSVKPKAPFTTSTMQQESAKNLGFATNKTMMLAQQLYEGVDIKGRGSVGLLTYIRTDSTRIAPEAFEELKIYAAEHLGAEYTPDTIRTYKNKSSAQDAHEAVRPTYVDITPEEAAGSLSKDQLKLYRLVWQRYVASQLPDAQYSNLTTKITAGSYHFRTTYTTLMFDGYLKVYGKKEDSGDKLPELNIGDELNLISLNKNQHFTAPPARYNDASLVKTLEERGIGRPSTYASIITTLTARNYVTKENKVFYPTELGDIINEILTSNFENIVDVDFTASMEQDLDRVENGDLNDWKDILRNFYPSFEIKLQEAEENIEETTVEDQKTDVICEKCGNNMVIKFGRFGKFLACPNFPDCRNAKPFLEESGATCPICSGKVLIKKSKKGRKFFSCENNPDTCNFISWNKPIEKPCPLCGSFLVERGTKKVTIACSNEACKFVEAKVEEEDDDPTEAGDN